MDKEKLQYLISENITWSGVVRGLGLPVHGGNICNVQKKAKLFGINTSHFVGRNHPRKYTKEVLQDAVAKSVSYAELCNHLGVKWHGGIHNYLKTRIKEYQIDTSHFLGRKANSGKRHKGGNKRKSANEILVKRKEGRRHLSYVLRRALIESGRKYICEKCGIGDSWCGEELRLQVDHKNGNVLDDRPVNLQFLCPNCHSQTNGWCNSQGLTEVNQRRKNSNIR